MERSKNSITWQEWISDSSVVETVRGARARLLRDLALANGRESPTQLLDGPLPVKVSAAQIPNLSEVNKAYWKYPFEKRELDGLGYFCTRCGESRIVKAPEIDEETGMLARD